MIKKLTLFIGLFLLVQYAMAIRPTIQTSNFSYSNLECNKVLLTWVNGNGSSRIIIAREGAVPSFTPVDGEVYIANTNFGSSIEYPNVGDGNFIVYNAVGANISSAVTGLKQGVTYYFTIYEHDNNGNNTQYQTNNAPSTSITTHSVTLSMTTLSLDSCEKSNRFVINNMSSSTIPGLTYLFKYGNDTTSKLVDTITVKGFGFKTIMLSSVSNLSGCSASISKLVKIFPKKMVTLDFSNLTDSIQFFDGNYFEVRTKSILAPFPMGVMYNWHTGDSLNQTFPFLRKNYSIDGKFRVMLVLNATSYTKNTGCFDTLYFNLEVLHNPRQSLSINNDIQYLSENSFYFENFDATVINQKWFFGDGDSTQADSCTHRYLDTGKYIVSNYVETNFGYKGTRNYEIRVLADSLADDTTATKIIRIQNSQFKIYPNPNLGILQIDIQNPLQGDAIEIYDLNGKIIQIITNIKQNNSIDLSHLNAGIYNVQYKRLGQVVEYELILLR